MVRSAIGTMAVALMFVGMICGRLQAIDTVEWVGPASGFWNDANVWKNTTTNVTGDAVAIFGQGNGSDGMNNSDPNLSRARDIVIGGGATVAYNAEANDSDFRIRQGSNLTIKEGAMWTQNTDETWTENRWTQFDPSNLIIDGGTLRRTGQALPGGADGGGLMMFATYRGGANFGTLPPPEVVNVEIKNGGKIENTGPDVVRSRGGTPAQCRGKFHHQ